MNTHIASPLQLDVVYTYVNPSAPSFARHANERNASTDPTRRYSDWEELRYSLRALKAYALDSDALRQYDSQYAEDVELLTSLGFHVEQKTFRNSDNDNNNNDVIINVNENATGINENSSINSYGHSLIRRIYLVLSDVDQVPDWLNVSEFAMLRVVTHSELFTASEQVDALPSFNSLSIESALHRIANLSNFFWYFNDDMLLGRKLSLFDLLSPVSYEMQQLYLRYLHHANVNDNGRTIKSLAEELEEFENHISTHHTRSVIFMEPIYSVDDIISTTQEFVPSEEVIIEETNTSKEHAIVDSGNSLINRSMEKRTFFSFIANGIKSIFFLQISANRSKHWRDNLDVSNSRLMSAKFTHVNFTGAYAHKPLLIYREMYNLLTESTRIGFHEEIHALRHTYSRAQSQTSPVHLYTPYMQIYHQYANNVLLELLNTTRMNRNQEEIIEFCEEEKKKNIEELVVDKEVSVIIHDTNEAEQTELSSVHKLTIMDQEITMGSVNLLKKFMQSIMEHISNTIKNIVCYFVSSCFASTLLNKSNTMQNIEPMEKHVFNMLTKDYALIDVDNHEYWFVVLDSEVKLLLSLTRAVDIAQSGKCPLFVTINDDLPNTNGIRTKTWHLHSDNGNTTTLSISTMIHFLLYFCVGKVPSTPWEK